MMLFSGIAVIDVKEKAVTFIILVSTVREEESNYETARKKFVLRVSFGYQTAKRGSEDVKFGKKRSFEQSLNVFF